MNQKETMAYLAGIIDGEGHLEIRKVISSIGNPCYYARMSFFMQDRRPTELFAKVFGSKVLTTEMGGKKYYGIAVGSNTLGGILKKLLPYLQMRKQQAIYLLELIEDRKKFLPHCVFRNGKLRGREKVPVEFQKKREKLFRLCKLCQEDNS